MLVLGHKPVVTFLLIILSVTAPVVRQGFFLSPCLMMISSDLMSYSLPLAVFLCRTEPTVNRKFSREFYFRE